MKNVIIRITALQYGEDDRQELAEFTTEGAYDCTDGCGTFRYPESELTGMEGTETTVEFTPDGAVLTRRGTVNSRMVFSGGQRNTFLYETPYGSPTVGLETQRYQSTLGDAGGTLEIHYVVDFDHALVGRNELKITIKEQRG